MEFHLNGPSAVSASIRTIIAGELDAAAESVVAAVAWLTDPVLLEALVKTARRGCRVQLALLRRLRSTVRPGRS